MKQKSMIIWSIIGFGLFLLLALTYDVAFLQVVDVYVMEHTHVLHTSWGTEVMLFLAWIGSVKIMSVLTIILVLLIGIIKRNFFAALIPAIVMLGTGVFNATAKQLINRARPDLLPLIDQPGYSFPSGHTMASVSFCGVIIYLCYMFVQHQAVRIAITIGMVSFSLLMGFSRIYLGVHFLTDIVGGILLSVSWLLFTVFIVKSLEGRKETQMTRQQKKINHV